MRRASWKERTRCSSDSFVDGEQFVHAMRAGVPRADAREPVLSQLARHLLVGEQGAQVFLHLGAVARNEIIFAWCEEVLGVFPRRTDERNLAGECFKRANGRDAARR